MLDQLGERFSPPKVGDDGKPVRRSGERLPIDVLLATSMISVGVDVGRLGLMCAVGQPKMTAEYIQATSRVGRDRSGPGLVVTIYNWSRPRDMSHYETFEHYHATFYRHVEALSVTPFSSRALDRGLTAAFVSLMRHAGSPAWNPNTGAQIVDFGASVVDEFVDAIAARGADGHRLPGGLAGGAGRRSDGGGGTARGDGAAVRPDHVPRSGVVRRRLQRSTSTLWLNR